MAAGQGLAWLRGPLLRSATVVKSVTVNRYKVSNQGWFKGVLLQLAVEPYLRMSADCNLAVKMMLSRFPAKKSNCD